MRVLVVGGGGREHALCWRLAQDPSVTQLYVAPGNAGIAGLPGEPGVAECIPGARPDDIEAMVNLVDRLDADLVVIGPEAPLVAGLGDALRREGRNVFGPNAAAARIEGSKAFAKEVMASRGVPTARWGRFEEVAAAVAFVEDLGGRAVVKADGLAAGKGVTVAADRAEAEFAIRASLVDGAFGAAGATVVVEEVLEGPEVSVFAVTDGHGSALLDVAQDAKRIGDGDTGPNTGGMGAYSPVPFVDEATATKILDTVIAPVVDALRPYRGVLFAGMMLTEDGPKVLEFNCRFGDPETQVLMARMPHRVGTLLHACATGRLAHEAGHAGSDDGAAVTVVLASEGYPGPYEVGRPIDGLHEAGEIDGVTVFHAGTARTGDGLVTAGGRVLAVTGRASSLHEARSLAYEGVARISFEGMRFRTDIAAHAVALEGANR